MENINFNIAKVLALHLSGKQLDNLQKEMLEKWLENNSENRKLYTELKNKQLRKQRSLIHKEIDISEEWKKFEQKSSYKKIYLKRKIVFTLQRAAVIAIPIFIAITTYYLVNTSSFTNKRSELSQEIIHPGTQRAKLILSSGKIINLVPDSLQSITEEKGTIIENKSSVLSYKTSSSLKNKLFKKEIVYNTLIIEKGWEYQLILPDGSKVWLNSESTFKYPVTFSDKKRIVELTGEAYFEVAKNKDKPFIVKTTEVEIEVLGTSFNISSYKDEKDVKTTLVEGSVKVIAKMHSRTKQYLLEPNYQSVYNLETKTIDIKQVNTNNIIAWKDGNFVFENESLEDIFRKLSRWYDIELSFKSIEIKQLKFSGKIPRFDNCNTILEMMEKTTNVKFITDGTKIKVEQI